MKFWLKGVSRGEGDLPLSFHGACTQLVNDPAGGRRTGPASGGHRGAYFGSSSPSPSTAAGGVDRDGDGPRGWPAGCRGRVRRLGPVPGRVGGQTGRGPAGQ